MIKRYFLYSFFLFFVIGLIGCNNNKIACPTYADSFPEKKKKGKPGEQKPEIPKPMKAKSGVLPTDGRGSRTKVPR